MAENKGLFIFLMLSAKICGEKLKGTAFITEKLHGKTSVKTSEPVILFEHSRVILSVDTWYTIKHKRTILIKWHHPIETN